MHFHLKKHTALKITDVYHKLKCMLTIWQNGASKKWGLFLGKINNKK